MLLHLGFDEATLDVADDLRLLRVLHDETQIYASIPGSPLLGPIGGDVASDWPPIRVATHAEKGLTVGVLQMIQAGVFAAHLFEDRNRASG
jgi:hypothetical protein